MSEQQLAYPLHWPKGCEAYRKRAMETHPDRGGSAEAFDKVRKAFENACAWWEANHGGQQ